MNQTSSLDNINLTAAWRQAIYTVIAFGTLILGVYWETWGSMASIWIRSDTFTHGFLVLPTSIWLIWNRRENYLCLSPGPDWKAFPMLLAGGFLWLTADLIHVLVIKQFAVVVILLTTVWAILGKNIACRMLFPLCFLFFMVPFGEAIIPLLMEFTATFTVKMLQITGIPVYREGLYFTLTTGSWSVIDACSGIRYLIASFTLGVIYAYLNYANYWKRALFIFLSLTVPVLANGLRAYMIVMLGHLSGMELATGVDHIIYGWLFFGLVIMVLFYTGSYWRDPESDFVSKTPELNAQAAHSRKHGNIVLLLVAISIMPWPQISLGLSERQSVLSHLSQAEMTNEWQSVAAPSWGWQPHFNGVAAELTQFFDKGKNVVGVYQATFGNESQGDAELVNSQHVLVAQKDKLWRIVSEQTVPFTKPNGESFTADRKVLRSDSLGYDICVLQWYSIGEHQTANTYHAKLLQLSKRLTGNTADELLVLTFAKSDLNKYEEACTTTNELLKDTLEKLPTWPNSRIASLGLRGD